MCIALWVSQLVQQWRMYLPVQETWEPLVWSLGEEDPLEKEMATHSSLLAWEVPWTEDLVDYSPWGRKKVDMTVHANTSIAYHVWRKTHKITSFILCVCVCVLLSKDLEGNTLTQNHGYFLRMEKDDSQSSL